MFFLPKNVLFRMLVISMKHQSISLGLVHTATYSCLHTPLSTSPRKLLGVHGQFVHDLAKYTFNDTGEVERLSLFLDKSLNYIHAHLFTFYRFL